MKICKNCHEQSEEQFDSCWNCGVDLAEGEVVTLRSLKKKPKTANQLELETHQSANSENSQQTRKGNFPALVLFFLGISVMGFIFLGHYHIVTGTRYISGINGIEFIERDSFGYSEIYIDADAIVDMPMIIAIASYPVGYKVLLREKNKHRR